MNFQHCRYVQAIAETGSFSEAAKKLFMTQPNLSSAIKDLEHQLGVQLFIRSNTGARLTEDGQDFLKYAQRIIGEVNLLEERYQKDFKKTFTVASHHYDFLSHPMATIAEQFKDTYQEFQILETTTKRILESVAHFESDLGIIYIDDNNRNSIEHHLSELNLEFQPLGNFPTRIFLRQNHPLAGIGEIKASDLHSFPQIRFRQDHSSLTLDEDTVDVFNQQNVIYCSDRGTLMNLLCETDSYASGLGIVNSFVKEQIVLIPLKDSPSHTLGIVTNARQKTSKIRNSFIEEIKKSLINHLI